MTTTTIRTSRPCRTGTPHATPRPRGVARTRVHGPRRPTPRVAPARYRRRRLAVVLAVASIVGGAAVVADGLVSGSGGVPASAAGTGATSARRVVRAAPGDSLWSIAAEHRGDVPITRFVEKVIDLNGGTRIEAGQLVRLP